MCSQWPWEMTVTHVSNFAFKMAAALGPINTNVVAELHNCNSICVTPGLIMI